MTTVSLKRLTQRAAPWLLPLLLLAAWQGSVAACWLSTRILPAPSAVLEAGLVLVSGGELWQHLAISGWRAGIGFAIGGGLVCYWASSPACRAGASGCWTAPYR